MWTNYSTHNFKIYCVTTDISSQDFWSIYREAIWQPHIPLPPAVQGKFWLLVGSCYFDNSACRYNYYFTVTCVTSIAESHWDILVTRTTLVELKVDTPGVGSCYNDPNSWAWYLQLIYLLFLRNYHVNNKGRPNFGIVCWPRDLYPCQNDQTCMIWRDRTKEPWKPLSQNVLILLGDRQLPTKNCYARLVHWLTWKKFLVLYKWDITALHSPLSSFNKCFHFILFSWEYKTALFHALKIMNP